MARVFYLLESDGSEAGFASLSRGFKSSNLPDYKQEGGTDTGGAPSEAGASTLPCQDSNNCTGGAFRRLASNHRKSAYALKATVESLVETYGIERVGFLTLTFADHVLEPSEAQRRWHSLATHVLNHRYNGRFVRVFERQKSGRIHYHVLVVVADDIRSGFSFEQAMNGVYKSAGPALRREWAFWRTTAPKYGFGRTELMPIRSCTAAISEYVGKYIAKHIGNREERDKGVRLVSTGKGLRNVTNTRFAWATSGAGNWRRKLGWLALRLGYTSANYQAKFIEDFGSSWAYHLSKWVMQIRFTQYPSKADAIADWPDLAADRSVPDDAISIELPDRDCEAKRSQARALLVAFDLRAKYARRSSDSGCEVEGHEEVDATSTQRETTRSEHCQGGDVSPKIQTAWLQLANAILEGKAKHTTLTSAVESYNRSEVAALLAHLEAIKR